MSDSETFDLAVLYIKNSFGLKQYPENKTSQEDQLKFYGLYKQVNDGNQENHQDKAPGFFSFAAKKKWATWGEYKDVTKEEAQKQYVELLTKCFPKWLEYEGMEEFKKK